MARTLGTLVRETLACGGASTQACAFAIRLQVLETFYGRKLVGVAARAGRKLRRTRRIVTVGLVRVTLHGGQRRLVSVRLNGLGLRLLRARKQLPVALTVLQGRRTVRRQRVVFHLPKPKRKR